MTLDDDVTRLARTRPFSLLPREAVQLLAFSCEKRRLRAGEALFEAGEIADSGYFVHSGAVLLVEDGVDSKDGRRVGAGVLIGETALYAPIARRVAARAAEDTVVVRVPRDTFRRVLTEFPAAAERIRIAVATRTHQLIEGLEAARVRSLDVALAPTPRPVTAP